MGDVHASDNELVALLALLEEAAAADPRRRYPAWSTIGAQVARRGSAIALWDERHPLTLDGLGEADCALDKLDQTRHADCGRAAVRIADRRYR